MSENWRTFDGKTLRAYQFGNENAAPERRLLIVCGAFLPAGVYWPFAKALAKELGDDWSVWVYDRRGKGNSSDIDDDYKFSREVEDVITGLRESGAKHLFGHSLGGSIVLHTAKRLGKDPQSQEEATLLPTSTSLYDPAVNIDGTFDTSWLPRFRRHAEAGHIGRAMGIVQKHMGMSRTLSHAPVWLLSLAFGATVRTGFLWKSARKLYPAGVAEVVAALKENNKASDFSQIDTTWAVVTGERSAEYFHATAKALAEAMPKADLIVSPKGVHGSIPAVAHDIVESMAKWLKDIPVGDKDLGEQALKTD